jgi:hypothetical protein
MGCRVQRLCNGLRRTGRFIEPINASARRRVGQPVSVHAERDRWIFVPQLLADVGDRFAGLQQQRRERMAHLMRPASMQFEIGLKVFRTFDSSRGVPTADGKTQSGRFKHTAGLPVAVAHPSRSPRPPEAAPEGR